MKKLSALVLPAFAAVAASLSSCVVAPGPPGAGVAVVAPGVRVGFYDTLPGGYDDPYYFYGGRYYYGGAWEAGRYRWHGRWYSGRYRHNGHVYYGGRWDGGHHHHR